MRRIELLVVTFSIAVTGGCRDSADAPANQVAPGDLPPVEGPVEPTPTLTKRPSPTPAPALLGQSIVLAEWGKAANRASCAPLAFQSDGKAGGTARRATFSGGWAVAFDQPDRRSAYGIAGAGVLPDDRLDFAVQVDQLTAQWPYVRRWSAGQNLPAASIAGYGLEGARDYPAGSSGYGRQSLAYLRIPGQACLYNVWSKLGRDHLELLLDELRMVPR